MEGAWLYGCVDSSLLIKTVTRSWQDISNYFSLILEMSCASCSFSAALLLSIIAYLACFFYNKNGFLSAAGLREIAFCQWQHNSRPQVHASYRLNVTDHACTSESQRCVLFLNLVLLSGESVVFLIPAQLKYFLFLSLFCLSVWFFVCVHVCVRACLQMETSMCRHYCDHALGTWRVQLHSSHNSFTVRAFSLNSCDVYITAVREI